MYESDDEQSEREFHYHEGNNKKNNNDENNDSMSRYAYVRYLGLIFSRNDRTLG